MNARTRVFAICASLAVIPGAELGAGKPGAGPSCKPVHARMTESRSTTECQPGHTACFLGEVDGNHGLRGTTYFHADSAGTPPPTSTAFTPYSGVFEYTTSRGVITTRETGVSSGTEGHVTAFQRITSATGEYAGLTGFFYVHGTLGGGQVETTVSGELCQP
jgi:hypothetical protein